MGVMDYTKCMHCSRMEKLANSTSSDTKLYSDCWLCEEGGSFMESEYSPLRKFNNFFVYGLASFFLGTVLLCCTILLDVYSWGWWILTLKGSALIVFCVLLLYSELPKGE
jgi:hypothetical protein